MISKLILKGHLQWIMGISHFSNFVKENGEDFYKNMSEMI